MTHLVQRRAFIDRALLLLTCALLFTGNGTVAFADGPVALPAVFEHYEIKTGVGRYQTVLTGCLLGGTVADVVTVHIDERENRQVRIYAFNGATWVLARDLTPRAEILFVDVVNLDGRDQLIIYSPGRLSALDPASATERVLVNVISSFDPPRKKQIPHVDVTRDLNGDGQDDLVVPGKDGFWVSTQEQGGLFAEPVRIGLVPDPTGDGVADLIIGQHPRQLEIYVGVPVPTER